GHYSMKLYREEVSPLVDLALDVSESMFFDETKARRVVELFYFCVESALQANCSLRCHAVSGVGATPLPLDAVMAHELSNFRAGDSTNSAPNMAAMAARHGSLRVLVSDLLF